MRSSQNQLVKIGNSWVVRIPKQALVTSGFDKTNGVLDLYVEPGKIALTPSTHPRSAWPKQIMDEVEQHGPIRKVW